MSRENSEIKRKFNIIDAIVIVLAVLCILTICLRSQINNLIGLGEKTSDYKLSFKVASISSSSFEYFEKNENFWDTVYLDSPDIELGVIEGDPIKAPATTYIDGADGIPVAVECPENTLIDIMGDIRCHGVVKEDGCFYLS